MSDYGPNSAAVEALLDRCGSLTADEVEALAAAGAAWGAAWDARDAAADAALALATRHLVGTGGYTQRHYDLLIGPWLEVIGPCWGDDDAHKVERRPE